MELKSEEKVNTEYAQNSNEIKQQNEQLNSNNSTSKNGKSTKPKKSLKKWGIVGATLIVAGIVGAVAYVNYQNSGIAGGIQVYPADSITKIQLFNSQYTNYFGKNKSLSEIKALVSMTNANNFNTERIYSNVKISADNIVTYNEVSKTYSVDGPNAKMNNFYIIDAGAFNADGSISEIKIEVNDREREDRSGT